MATSREYIENKNLFYNRYKTDWALAYNAYIGGVEWRKGRYLKQYQIDLQTPTEEIRTHEITDMGLVSKGKSPLHYSISAKEAEFGFASDLSNFYGEKLSNTPLFPYVRLYVSEYNSILFQKVPTRFIANENTLTDNIAQRFIKDVDGDGNSINEFMAQVDVMTTVFGVCWISCVKPLGGEYPLWNLHKPTDVVNWTYGYNEEGKNELRKIAILINQNEDAKVYRIFTPTEIKTVWIPTEEDTELDIPDAVYEDGTYIITRPNELGYIPVKPVYQSMKVYDGVGHTPMFDISQIQRSVYNYAGELYTAVTYGAHPVTIVDKATAALNGNNIGAEPGTTITVENGITENNYVFEFKAPPLDSIKEIRELMDQLIEKMNVTAMIRSEDLIKASRSGAQIETYDSKLEAFIRKKAISLENSEYHLWMIWHDWLGITPSDELKVEYNKLYGNKGIKNGIEEIDGLVDLYTKVKEQIYAAETPEEVAAMEAECYDIQESIKQRFRQIIMAGYTENSQ